MRETLVLSEDAWHVKVYRFWQRYGYIKKFGYMENLCHYWRCVVLWAAVRAFVSYPIAGIEWLRGITIAAVVVVVGGLTTLLVLWPWDTLLGIGMFLALCVFVLVIAAAGDWIANHPRETVAWLKKYVWSWFRYIALPIWWGLKKIGRGIVWVGGSIAELAEPETWAKIGAVFFLVVAFAGIIFALTAAFLDDWLATLLFLAGVLVVAGVVLGTYFAYQHRKDYPKPDKGPGLTRVSYEYVVSGKHRICPFIKIGHIAAPEDIMNIPPPGDYR